MQISEKKQKELDEYVNHQLAKDLDTFEDLYGYRGNRFLAYWLILNKVFPEDLEFTARGGMYYIIYSTGQVPFLRNLQKHPFSKQQVFPTIGELIPLITPFVPIGNDGRGGFYYATFFEDKNEVFVYDHDPEEYVKLPKSLESLIKLHSIKKVLPLLEEIVEKHEDHLQLTSIVNHPKRTKYSVRKLMTAWPGIGKMITAINQLKSIYKKEESDLTPFDFKKHLLKSIQNEGGDYHLYNDHRAVCNSTFVRNYFWFFFTGQLSTLQQYIEETKDIKGIHYQSIRNVFLELVNSNHPEQEPHFDKIEKIRGFNGLKVKKFYKDLEEKESSGNYSADDLLRFRIEMMIELGCKKLFVTNREFKTDSFKTSLKGYPKIEIFEPYWAKLSALKDIYMANFTVIELPNDFWSLTRLESLVIYGCKLNGLPKEIQQLSNLKTLSVSYNDITEVPEELSQLRRLEELEVANNKLKHFPNFPPFPYLKKLSLMRNFFEKFPKGLENHPNLYSLNLGLNQIKTLPPEIAKLKSLIYFKINKNQLSELPIEITTLPKLSELDLSNNQFQEDPTSVIESKYARRIRIDGNPFNQ